MKKIKETEHDRLRTAIQYIGFGDPNSRVWFFGSEEAVEWTVETLSEYRNIAVSNDSLSADAPTYKGYQEILTEVFDGNVKECFISNVMPIGKPPRKNDFSNETREIFGFDEVSYKDLLSNIKEERLFALELFFKIFNWKDKCIFLCTSDPFNIRCMNELFQYLMGDPKIHFHESETEGVHILSLDLTVFNLYHASTKKITAEHLKFINKHITNALGS